MIEASKYQKILLIFNGKLENSPFWGEQFLSVIENKNLSIDSEKNSEAKRDAVQRNLSQKSLGSSIMLLYSEKQEWIRNI